MCVGVGVAFVCVFLFFNQENERSRSESLQGGTGEVASGPSQPVQSAVLPHPARDGGVCVCVLFFIAVHEMAWHRVRVCVRACARAMPFVCFVSLVAGAFSKMSPAL